MERKKNVKKRSVGRNKRKKSWLNVRKVIPLLLLLALLLFSMAAASYMIFFHITPSQEADVLSPVQVRE